MKEHNFDQKFIDTYIRQKHLLSGEELTAFEDNLENNKSFAAEVQLQEDIAQGVKLHFDTALKEKLKQAGENHSETAKVFSLRYVSLAAASIVAILLVYTGLFQQEKSSEEIFATYYTTYPNIIDPAERGSYKAGEMDAYMLYEQKSFKEAIAAFKNKLVTDQQDLSATFYLGVSGIEANKPDIAMDNLQKVANSEDVRFANPARWYLALYYIKQGKTTKANRLLKSLKNSESSYASKAEALLNEL